MEVPMNFCFKKKSQSVLTGNDQDTFWGFFFYFLDFSFFHSVSQQIQPY